MHGRIKVKTSEEKEVEAAKFRKEDLSEQRRLWNCLNEVKRVATPDKGQEDAILRYSAELLLRNPDFYTLFNLRKQIMLRKVEQTLRAEPATDCRNLFVMELDFTKRCLMINPKSYSVWYHRRWALLKMPEPDWRQELKLCTLALDLDERNFHCWSYRRFVAKQGKISPATEFAYTYEKIINNFSNYSAWHYRSNLLPVILDPASNIFSDCTPEVRQKVLDDEVELINSAMYTDPGDEAVWHYTQWLLHFAQHQFFDADAFKAFLGRIRESVEEVISLEPTARRPLAMSLDLTLQFPTIVGLNKEIAQKRLAVLCREDPMRKNCYLTLYGNIAN